MKKEMSNVQCFLLCLERAKEITRAVRDEYGNIAAFACGDPPSTNESSAKMFQALEKFAPGAIKALANITLPVGQTLLDANRVIAPQQAQLETDIYRNYAPGMAKVGSDISAQQNLAASESELALARGPGRDLVKQAVDMQAMVDPQAERTKELVGKGIEQFLAAQNGGQMTPTEIEQINRGLAQRGDANLAPSALKTLNAARTFGDAGTAKWNQFGQALSTAAAAIPTLRSGISGFEVATRRQVGQDPTTRLSNPNPVSAQAVNAENFGFANNALNQIGATQRTSINKQESVMDKIGKGTQALSNVASIAAV